MLKLALRNILRHRMRTALTLCAIGLGVASLILSGGFVQDILLQLREATIRSQLGHVQIYKAGNFASGGQRPFDFLIEKPAEVDAVVRALPQVVAQGKRLNFSGLISNGHGELPILAQGVEPEPEAKIGSAMTFLSGRNLKPTDRSAIVIGEGLASAMKLKIDDSVNLVVNTREGAMNTLDFTIVGVFRTLSKEYDARAVRIALGEAQELTAVTGVSAVVVLLSDADDTARAAAQLKASLPPAYEVKTWLELADFYNSTVALYERQFAVLQAIIIVMVLLSVANSVNMTLHERTPEFGIMRALGRRGKDVFRLAVLETAVLGVAGAAVGIAAGVLLAVLISLVGISMPPPPNSESGFTAAIRIVPSVVAGAFLLGVVASIVAALLPARHLARIPVVEALRRGV